MGRATDKLVAEFDQEIFRIYQRAHSEAHCNATRFLQMLHEHRGLETAKILLHSTNVSEGYTALWERGRFGVLPLRRSFTTTPNGIRYLRKTTWRCVQSGSRSIATSRDNKKVEQRNDALQPLPGLCFAAAVRLNGQRSGTHLQGEKRKHKVSGCDCPFPLARRAKP